MTKFLSSFRDCAKQLFWSEHISFPHLQLCNQCIGRAACHAGKCPPRHKFCTYFFACRVGTWHLPRTVCTKVSVIRVDILTHHRKACTKFCVCCERKWRAGPVTVWSKWSSSPLCFLQTWFAAVFRCDQPGGAKELKDHFPRDMDGWLQIAHSMAKNMNLKSNYATNKAGGKWP